MIIVQSRVIANNYIVLAQHLMDPLPKKRDIDGPVKGPDSKRLKQDEEEDDSEEAMDTKCTPEEIVGIEIEKR